MSVKDLARSGVRRVATVGGLELRSRGDVLERRIDHLTTLVTTQTERLERERASLRTDLDALAGIVSSLQLTLADADPEQAMEIVRSVRDHVARLAESVGELRAH